jgi:CRP-like cAMP-binding protein
MISPELLKRYPFFSSFTEDQLKEFAMIAEEESAEAGQELFQECGPAVDLYLLLVGEVDLFYKSEEQYHPKTTKEFLVGEINPGEIFSISTVIEPYVLNATGRVTKPSRYVRFDGKALRALMGKDALLGYLVMLQVTKAVMERLAYTRVQLAACWAG